MSCLRDKQDKRLLYAYLTRRSSLCRGRSQRPTTRWAGGSWRNPFPSGPGEARLPDGSLRIDHQSPDASRQVHGSRCTRRPGERQLARSR